MIINSVRLKNFKSHGDTTIEFGRGINVILGENGAGKTSILEALGFALFKVYSGSMESLLRRGQKGLEVDVVFSIHGRTYKVVRKRLKNSTESSIFLVDGKEQLLQSGDSGVDREISEILGIDRHMFSNSVYVRQGDIAKLLLEKPSEKKKLIGRLLGIDSLEKVWEGMRPVIDVYREKKSLAEGRVMKADGIRTETEAIEKEMHEAKKRMEAAKKSLSSVSIKLAEAEKEEKSLREAEKSYSVLCAARDSLRKSLGRENERIRSLRSQLDAMLHSEKELEKTAKQIPGGWKDEMKSSIKKCQAGISSVNENVGALRGKVSELREMEGKLKEVGGVCPLCGSNLTREHRENMLSERKAKIGEAEKEILKLEKERLELTVEIESLGKRRDELTELERRHAELKAGTGRGDQFLNEKSDSEKVAAELAGKISESENGIKLMEESRKGYEKAALEAARLRSELSVLREELGRNHGKLQELENSLKRSLAEEEEIKKHKKEHANLTGFLKVLEEIRSLFDKSGLQHELRKRAVPIIESHMKDYFRKFNFEYSDISLDEDYDVTLHGSSGSVSTDMMSGGEKIAAAIALRLGIASALAGSSAESLILDEPTIFLDEQRRQDLVEVFRRLSVMPQIIVVTHDSSLEEAADRIVMIKKSKGVSFVEDG